MKPNGFGVVAVCSVVLVLTGCAKTDSASQATKTEPGSTASTTTLNAPDTSSATPPTTAAPAVMPDVVGKALDVAKTDITNAGFKDKVEVIGGGSFGVVLESQWTVCAQTPAVGATVTEAPQLTVDRSCGGGSTNSSTPPTTATTVPAENLMVANSTDLAALLTGGHECDDTTESFASAHSGRTIEFDGNIALMELHGEKTTRYDVLLYGGNSGENYNGPNFKFEDVGIADLGLTGPNIPDRVGAGDNVHVVAKVESFNRTQCLFFLDPVSTEVR